MIKAVHLSTPLNQCIVTKDLGFSFHSYSPVYTCARRTCSHTIHGGIRQMLSEITSVYSLLDYTILFERAPLRSIREKHPQKCYQFSSLRQNYKQCDINMLYIVFSSLSWKSRGLGWHLDTQVEKCKVEHDIYCIFEYKHQKLYMPMYIT